MEITRPINCAITFLSVLLGGWLGTLALTHHLLLAALSAALITGGGNVLNDLCGVAEDRINKPQRPLPSGRLSHTSATILTSLLLLSGLIIGFSLPSPAPIIVCIAVIGLALYNFWLKRVPLLGNLVVSALGGLAFLYGGFAVHAYQPARWPALFATLFHLGREILKDLEDITGDQVLSGSTIPLSWGRPVARAIITAIFSTLILLTPLPAIIDIYGTPYFILVSILNILLIYVLIRLLREDTPATLSHLNHLLKASMILGLCAFFFDRL
ncbi:MAG: geranylgeranylglycerol-phosphate geranylgeranyltransferase [Candidatus Latescibacterota bacterium]